MMGWEEVVYELEMAFIFIGAVVAIVWIAARRIRK